MRTSIARLSPALLLVAPLLVGCVANPYPYPAPSYPPSPPYQAGGYPPPGYPPGPPPAPPGEPYVGPDGLTYVDGYPVAVFEGAPAPWFFLPELGGWGYYDSFHRWHGAPPDMRARLERAHPGGRGLGAPPARFSGNRESPAPGNPASPAFRRAPGPNAGPAPGPAPAVPRGPPPGRPAVPVNAAKPQPRQEPEQHRNCPPGAQACVR